METTHFITCDAREIEVVAFTWKDAREAYGKICNECPDDMVEWYSKFEDKTFYIHCNQAI